MREIVDNPFRRPVINPSWLTFQDDLVLRLARQIEDEGDFRRMPILGDALEEAGCTESELLRHCRGTDGFPSLAERRPAPRFGSLLRSLLRGWWLGVTPVDRYKAHVRGCWVIAAILDR